MGMIGEQFFEQVRACGIIPAIVIDRAQDAIPLGEALVAGGLPIAEVTLRTEAAIDAIREMRQVSGLLVGAGTVLNATWAKRAVGVGFSLHGGAGFE